MPGAPSAFGMALANLWYSMNDIWRGRMPSAFARPKAVAKATGTRWLNWSLPFLVTALAFGLTVSSAMGRGMTGINNFISGWDYDFGVSGMYSFGFGYYFRLFIYVTIVVFVFYILRTLAVWLAGLSSGVNTDFASAGTAVAVAANLLWLPLLVATVLLWIFPVGFTSMLLPVASLGLVLMVEITTYVGVTRLGRPVRSPLVPYVWYTVIAVIVTALFAMLAFPITL